MENKYYDKKCKCGCGNNIKILKCHKLIGVPIYIHGHHRKGVKQTKESNEKRRNKMKGRKRPDMIGENNPAKKIEARKKISESKIGDKNPAKRLEVRLAIGKSNKGKVRSIEDKKRQTEWLINKWKDKSSGFNNPKRSLKLRESRLAEIKKYGSKMQLGKNEKQILDELEKLFNYKIIRQYEIIGYILDGYIPEINLAIEVDEPFHKNQVEKDKIREQNIIDELECKFLRIKDE